MSADWERARVLTLLLICGSEIFGVVDPDGETQPGCPPQFGAHPGGGDERLGRNAVVEHTRAADAVGIHHGDLRPRVAATRAASYPAGPHR